MTFTVTTAADLPPAEQRATLLAQLAGLLAGERDPWANLANAAALLHALLPELNWAGFYLLRDGGLVVGPFQGKPACVRIALGFDRLVMVAAGARQIDDVLAFPLERA